MSISVTIHRQYYLTILNWTFLIFWKYQVANYTQIPVKNINPIILGSGINKWVHWKIGCGHYWKLMKIIIIQILCKKEWVKYLFFFNIHILTFLCSFSYLALIINIGPKSYSRWGPIFNAETKMLNRCSHKHWRYHRIFGK